MPRNGSGTYSRSNGVNLGSTTWQLDRDSGAKILANRHDVHDQDIADALTASLAKDGQTSPTATLPMAGFRHTNVGAASGRTEYGQVGQIQDCTYAYGGTSTGAANVYAITLSPNPGALSVGMEATFYAHQTNTGACTLNINGLGALAITKGTGAALNSKDILSGHLIHVKYDGTGFRLTRSATDGFIFYSPATLTCAGAMTISAIVTNVSEYKLDGDWLTVLYEAQFTLGGTASNSVILTLPFVTRGAAFTHAYGYFSDTSGETALRGGMITTSTFGVGPSNGAVWPLGTNKYFRACITSRVN